MEDKAGKKKLSLVAPISGLVEMQSGDLDQQLICYAYNTAVIAVTAMVSGLCGYGCDRTVLLQVLGEVKVLDGMITEAKKPPKPKTPPLPEPKEEKTKGKKGKVVSYDVLYLLCHFSTNRLVQLLRRMPRPPLLGARKVLPPPQQSLLLKLSVSRL